MVCRRINCVGRNVIIVAAETSTTVFFFFFSLLLTLAEDLVLGRGLWIAAQRDPGKRAPRSMVISTTRLSIADLHVT